MADLNKLGRVLADAQHRREDELNRLLEMSDEQLIYLATRPQEDDPESDGLEGLCP